MQVFNCVPSFVIQRLNRHEPVAYFASRAIVHKAAQSYRIVISDCFKHCATSLITASDQQQGSKFNTMRQYINKETHKTLNQHFI